jgi:hypothetical protein
LSLPLRREYQNTSSRWAIIKLFFENAEFSRNYLFQMLKFKKLQAKEKFKKLVEF